ncbi:hypothetical protein GCM10011583_44690 [Streptomyces camponoticapitis]|uniref:Uncharacterized protein n=1 Tax=Streptomyces camponoticapitis TaxID=1616125 RepID=A0ABQ2EDI2_9ACTN|nr:hypothetical protein [Streptomyces camponoticapitis]GGK07860.1 hypothetical protein GCM10011583_44690 [Streptomyces camponoticapitis]
MGNSFRGGGDARLRMSNGGTAVFVDVLMLAVSDLAEEPWDYRFAALLALQDQNVVGGGCVGFDLPDIDWGATPAQCAHAKDFVLRTTDLALARHRWEELDYEAPYAQRDLRRFREMVENYEPAPAAGRTPHPRFPRPDEAAMASCVRHRILSALPHWEGCVRCSAQWD